jgi:uncharacterized repeat protein (TIGR03806 family)
MVRRIPALLVLTSVLLYAGSNASCSLLSSGVKVFLDEPYPETLSAWRLFERGSTPLRPNKDVVPYDLNTPLFSDYAAKYRTVWMPSGQSATYHQDEAFTFPVGTILSKTFAFPVVNASGEVKGDGERLIETRLLVHATKGWVALPYIWNEAQTEAKLSVAGGAEDVTLRDSEGAVKKTRYVIPNTNECAQCHEKAKTLLPIGLKARQLNRDFPYANLTENQIAHWSKVGYLHGAPALEQVPRTAIWNDARSGTVEARARAYLDANCAHCHQPEGSAGYTGFLLTWNEMDERRLGYCKNPNSAGYSGDLSFDVVPGKPDESILLYRMLSTRPKEMMPEIGRSVVHHEAAALVREWLAELKGNCGEAEK